MAILHIAEFQKLPKDAQNRPMLIARVAPHAEQNITYTSATASAVFNPKTKFIRVIADAKAHLAFGGAPVATVANMFIPANVAEYFAVTSGEKVSAWDGTT